MLLVVEVGGIKHSLLSGRSSKAIVRAHFWGLATILRGVSGESNWLSPYSSYFTAVLSDHCGVLVMGDSYVPRDFSAVLIFSFLHGSAMNNLSKSVIEKSYLHEHVVLQLWMSSSQFLVVQWIL